MIQVLGKYNRVTNTWRCKKKKKTSERSYLHCKSTSE